MPNNLYWYTIGRIYVYLWHLLEKTLGEIFFCGFHYEIKVVVTQLEVKSIFMAIITLSKILIDFLN